MYEITIKKKVEVESVERGPWVVIREEPWTVEDLRDEGAIKHGYEKPAEFLAKRPTKHIMGHAPDVAVKKIETTEVFTQVVDDLNLPEVIKAINNLR